MTNAILERSRGLAANKPVRPQDANPDTRKYLSLTRPFSAPNRTKVEVRHLDFSYGETIALSDISITIPEHQITAIIGPSGCGKSTLLRVINRIYELYPQQRAAGEVLIDGVDVLNKKVDVRKLRTRVGMVFQMPTPFPMSIRDNIAYGILLQRTLKPAEVDETVHNALVRTALWDEVKDRLNKSAIELSGGQMQRLCIARVLAAKPEVLLLDEPTGALDPLSMAKIELLIEQLRRDLTIVIVTHNMEQAARCADRVAFMYLGKLIECGSAKQIFGAPADVKTQKFIAGDFS